MLPTTPAGHLGSRFAPTRVGPRADPSWARASRAQRRAVTNSRRRTSTAFATKSSSPGNTASPGAPSKSFHQRAATVRSSREHLLRHRLLAAPAPLAGVPHRDFLEADAVVVGRARDVQVAIDDDLSSEPDVPIGGPCCAAPL